VADNLLSDTKIPPFASRVAELRTLLKSNPDAAVLAESPSLSAGVDMLSALFDDSDAAVRRSALEVYLRRVYRAHNVLTLQVTANTTSDLLNTALCSSVFCYDCTVPSYCNTALSANSIAVFAAVRCAVRVFHYRSHCGSVNDVMLCNELT
jgi:Acetyl-CoA carboxylase, central region